MEKRLESGQWIKSKAGRYKRLVRCVQHQKQRLRGRWFRLEHPWSGGFVSGYPYREDEILSWGVRLLKNRPARSRILETL